MKKVLISLDELVHWCKRYEDCHDMNACDDIEKWFEAQKEVTAVIYSESSAKMAEFAVLSKMETTGDEDADTR